MSEDGQNLPRTLDEAVDWLLARLNEESKRRLRETAEEDLIDHHLGWGMGIRNALGLWGANQPLREALGNIHPDSMSMVIMRAVWQRVQSG